MKQNMSPVVIGVIAAVLVIILGYFAWRTFAPVSQTSGGSNPYAGKPELKNMKPGENPGQSYLNHRGPGPGSRGPAGSSGGSSSGPPPQ